MSGGLPHAALAAGIAPVPEAALESHYRDALDRLNKDRNRERRFGVTKTLALLATLGYAGFMAWENRQLTQLAAENANRVIFVYTGMNGELHNSAAYSSLPVKFQTDNVLNSLWNYVYWRECWSQSEDPRAFYIVQRMSDDAVKRQWLGYIQDPKLSPRVRLGQRGRYYTCEPISYAPSGSDGDRYTFRFMRYEHDSNGRRDEGVSFSATLAYRTGVYGDDERSWVDRAVFNAPGIQVWDYPGGRPDAFQEHMVQREVLPQ